MLFVSIAIAQTQKELDDAMKKLQDVMKNLPPEAKKMMDSMKLNEKLTKSTKDLKAKGITDKQIKEQVDFNNLLIPPRNSSLISKSNKRLNNEADLKLFVTNSCTEIQKKLGAKRIKLIDSLYRIMVKHSKYNLTPYSALGDLLYLKGQATLALAAYSKEFKKGEVADYNDLNNFSVLCNMLGGTNISLPVLNFLNTKIPDNPIILNNIGQCWYTLGEKDSSSLFLARTIKILPDAPEANETMALIEKDNGNNEAAEKAFKTSFKNGFSKRKEQRGKDLGFKIARDDYLLPELLPYDPLGFSQIEKPPFQENMHNYYEWLSSYMTWEASIQKELERLNKEMGDLQEKSPLWNGDINSINNLMIQANKEIRQNGLSSLPKIDMNPYIFLIWSYQESNPEKLEGNFMVQHALNMKKIEEASKEIFAAIDEASKKLEVIPECYSPQDTYRYNNGKAAAKEKLDKEIRETIDFVTDILYYYTYKTAGTTLKIIEDDFKIKYLELLLHAKMWGYKPSEICEKKEVKIGPIKLSKWEDNHCKKYYDIQDPFGIVDFQVDCHGGHLLTPIFKQEDLYDENYKEIKGSVWVGLSVGKSVSGKESPIDIAAKWTQGWYFEYNDKEGLTDCGFQEEATLKIGVNYNAGGEYDQKLGKVYKNYPLAYKDADEVKTSLGSLPKTEMKLLETTSKVSYMSGDIKTTKFDILGDDIIPKNRKLTN